MSGSFVGRVAELATLRALSRTVLRDRAAGVAVVLGDPGSGKSRLLDELQESFDVPRLIRVGGYELEQDVSLACARGLLDELRAAPGGEPLDELVFGALAGAAPVEQIRVFEAAYRVLAGLTPLVVLVDDLHWADDTSLALFHYLVRAADADRRAVLLVAAARPSVRATRLIDSSARVLGDRACSIELGPLGRDEGVRVARELDPALDRQGAEELWAAARGSPFWLGMLVSADRRDETIAAMVAGRVGSSGADAATAIALLALAERPLLAEEVAEIQGWPAERVDAATCALERGGLAVRDAHAWSVAHDLVRDAVLRTIPVAGIRRLHARIGSWLLNTAGNDEQLLLTALEHLHRSGASVTSLAARLAGSPRRRLLGDAGLRRLSAILDDALVGDDACEELRERVARLAEELGDHGEALRRWTECASAVDPAAAARASLHASDAAMALGRRHDAWRHWEHARGRSVRDSALAVEVEAHRAALLWYLEHLAGESRATAEAALAAGRRLAEHSGGVDALPGEIRQALLRALGTATASALSDDDIAAALAFADERVLLAARFDERIEIRAIVDGAMALRMQGRSADAEGRLLAAWERARRDVLPQATLEVGAWLGIVLRSAGRLAEAEEIVNECLALGNRLVEFGSARAVTVALPHLVELSRGDWRRAVDGLRRTAAAEEDPHYRLHGHLERASVAAFFDPTSSAGEVLDAVTSAVADAERAHCRRCVAETSARGAEALARVGHLAQARSMLDRDDGRPSNLYNALCRTRALAVLAMAEGDEGAAIRSIEAVITDAEQQGLQLEALWSRLELASWLTRHDRHRAVETARAAGAIAERMGARTETLLAERLLRSLGMRTWRRAARTKDGELPTLTAREQEIAGMISDGASNPEIAAALFLSRKTVERHVSNILAKLGVRNRAELAARRPIG